MPHKLVVRCPECRCQANFEFATSVLIKKNTDLPYFEGSKSFEVLRFFNNGYYKVAVFFHGLGPRNLELIDDLPSEYRRNDWHHSRFWMRRHHIGDQGTIVCQNCFLRRKHTLDWPEDAFFKIALKGQELWAWDRKMAVALLNYIRSSERRPLKSGYAHAMRRLPKIFLESKSRATVVALLEKKLGLKTTTRPSRRNATRRLKSARL